MQQPIPSPKWGPDTAPAYFDADRPATVYAPVEEVESFADWVMTTLFGLCLSASFHATQSAANKVAADFIAGWAPEARDLIYQSAFALIGVIALTVFLRFRMTGRFSLANTWFNLGLAKLIGTHVWLTWSAINGGGPITSIGS